MYIYTYDSFGLQRFERIGGLPEEIQCQDRDLFSCWKCVLKTKWYSVHVDVIMASQILSGVIVRQ